MPQTTQYIRIHVRQAIGALGSGLVPCSAAVNAVGLFPEPRLLEDDLLAARAEIEAALEKMHSTVRPKDPDDRTAEFF